MSYHFLDDSGVATLWAAIKAKFIDVTKKGAANGVCPLNAYGVIPVEYIPGGGDEDIYLVNVATTSDYIPTTYDSEAVKDIPNHNNTFLRLTNGSNTNNAVFQYKYGGTYIFWCAFAVGADSYDIVTYSVDTGSGTITKDNIFTKPDDHIISSGTSNGWTYRKYASGVSECWGRFEYNGIEFEKAIGTENIGYFSTGPLRQESYPTSLFLSPPTEIDTIVGSEGNGWLVSGGAGNTSTKTSGRTYIARLTGLSGTGTYTISRHAIGSWK